MIRAFRTSLARFWRKEDGHAVIEFAITFPAMLVLLLSGIELGMISFQHAMLERAMDQTVRDIRLSTGNAPQHDDIKKMLCERSGFISNCNENMLLEMVQLNPRDWNGISASASCTDQSEEVQPKVEFKNDALENDLMILRACVKVDPIFPSTGLGNTIDKDGAGQFALVSVSAFVQEPN